MTSAEVTMLRNEIVGRLARIELGLFGEDGRGGLSAVVEQHLADHRRQDEVAEAKAQSTSPHRLAVALRDYWPFLVVLTTIAAFLIDMVVNHLTFIFG